MLPPLTPLIRFRLSLLAAGTGSVALMCLGLGSLLHAGGDELGGRIAMIAASWLAGFWAIALTGSAVAAAVISSRPPA